MYSLYTSAGSGIGDHSESNEQERYKPYEIQTEMFQSNNNQNRTTITKIEIGGGLGQGWGQGQGHVGSMGKGNSMMWLRVGTGCSKFSDYHVIGLNFVVQTITLMPPSLSYQAQMTTDVIWAIV